MGDIMRGCHGRSNVRDTSFSSESVSVMRTVLRYPETAKPPQGELSGGNMVFWEKAGKRREGPEGPLFVKPYSDRGEEMKALSVKLETAPAQSKHIFREALDALSKKADRHGVISRLLSESDLPALILYNVQVASRAGLTAIDFVILAPRFVMAIECSEDVVRPEDMPDPGIYGSGRIYPGDVACEEVAHILAEALRESGHFPAKMVRNVWPVKMITEEEAKRDGESGRRAFSSEMSRVFPDIRSAQVITDQELIGLVHALSESDYSASEMSGKKLFAMSDHLSAYHSEVTECPVPYRMESQKV